MITVIDFGASGVRAMGTCQASLLRSGYFCPVRHEDEHVGMTVCASGTPDDGTTGKTDHSQPTLISLESHRHGNQN